MTRFHFLRYLLILLLPTNLISLLGSRNESLLIEPKPNTELVVDRDGNVILMQQRVKPIWSFSTGSPIYSSYQIPHATSDFVSEYLDTTHNDDDGYDSWKIWTFDVKMEDLLEKTPIVTNDGVVTGSKTISAYLVDAISGKLVHVYKSNMETKPQPTTTNTTSDGDSVKLPLLIIRKDSKLECFDRTTRKLVWNVTVSQFRANLRCDPALNSRGGGNELGPEILTGIYLPLRCGSSTDVYPLVKPEHFVRVPRDMLLHSW